MPLLGQGGAKGSISCHLRRLWQSPLLATCPDHSRSWDGEQIPAGRDQSRELVPKLLLGCLHCPGVTLLSQTIRKEFGHFHWHFKGFCVSLVGGSTERSRWDLDGFGAPAQPFTVPRLYSQSFERQQRNFLPSPRVCALQEFQGTALRS